MHEIKGYKIGRPEPTNLRVLTKVGDTVLAPILVWPLEWNISVPVNTGDPFRVYRIYINTFLIPIKLATLNK